MLRKKYILLKNIFTKALKEHGVDNPVRLDHKSIEMIIESYTRESGVRTLEKCLLKLEESGCSFSYRTKN